MFVRNATRAGILLVLALVFNAVAVAATPRDRTEPTAPTNLRITATGPTSVSLAWNASKDNSTNWWYCVQRSGSGCFRVNPPQTTFTHPLLWPGAAYTFSVVARWTPPAIARARATPSPSRRPRTRRRRAHPCSARRPSSRPGSP